MLTACSILFCNFLIFGGEKPRKKSFLLRPNILQKENRTKIPGNSLDNFCTGKFRRFGNGQGKETSHIKRDQIISRCLQGGPYSFLSILIILY